MNVRNLLLRNGQSPGDVLMLIALQAKLWKFAEDV